jgi:hypothetical protein
MRGSRFSIWPILTTLVGIALEVGNYQNRTLANIIWGTCIVLWMVWLLVFREDKQVNRSLVTSGGVVDTAPRIFANVPIPKLVETLEPLTRFERKERLKTYKDKWFRIQGDISDIDKHDDTPYISVEIPPDKPSNKITSIFENITLTIKFGDSQWAQLSHAERGFYLKCEAQLEDLLSSRHLIFDRAVIIYLGSGPP